ncbi:Hypothetical predicted protein [Podarcis lilfordi]|uniref:Uncharacterized protein n=1 Tax=Podarcis lilfordi TaxID=74358 RepID=A0AA35K9S6_9SAUR|nr:Hypothetical predicted protein [Podarcis lilfordi]
MAATGVKTHRESELTKYQQDALATDKQREILRTSCGRDHVLVTWCSEAHHVMRDKMSQGRILKGVDFKYDNVPKSLKH